MFLTGLVIGLLIGAIAAFFTIAILRSAR